MTKEVKEIIELSLNLYEYERKQIISCLIASMLTDMSNKDAERSYNEIVNKLQEHII
mgnify:CR=1 FL=1|tara:strand:+ start:596 stop:766 length:171 start_codon:yes stop_codon:yes gene_type:complete